MLSRDLKTGDRRSHFDRLVDDALFNQLWRHACRLSNSREDAEDLIQEAMTAAFQSLHKLRDPAKVRPWLFAILRRRFLNQIRGRKRRLVLEEKMRLVVHDDNSGFDSDAVKEALQRVQEQHRWLLTAHYLEGLTTEDLAQALRTTNANIRQLLHRARKALLVILRSGELHSETEVA